MNFLYMLLPEEAIVPGLCTCSLRTQATTGRWRRAGDNTGMPPGLGHPHTRGGYDLRTASRSRKEV